MITDNKVFVVKSGIYSDKKWHGVFSSRKKAEELLKELNFREGGMGEPGDFARQDAWGEPQIEEWELDVPMPIEEGRYEVIINADGSVREWEFNNWYDANQSPDHFLGGYIGYGTTFELARRSAEEFRRADIMLRGG